LQKTEALLQEARASGVPVVHVQHCAEAGEAFAEGAPGWPIAPRLAPMGSEPLVRKRARNAFEGTELRAVLQGIGASSLVVAGIQSERCVTATCRGALELGYAVQLAQDGHSTWPDGARSAPEIITAQNEALAREGVVLSSVADLLKSFRGKQSR